MRTTSTTSAKPIPCSESGPTSNASPQTADEGQRDEDQVARHHETFSGAHQGVEPTIATAPNSRNRILPMTDTGNICSRAPTTMSRRLSTNRGEGSIPFDVCTSLALLGTKNLVSGISKPRQDIARCVESLIDGGHVDIDIGVAVL